MFEYQILLIFLMVIVFDVEKFMFFFEGFMLIWWMFDFEGLFCDYDVWFVVVLGDDLVVYMVVSFFVFEVECELLQLIIMIMFGDMVGEFWMIKGYQYFDYQGEIYFVLYGCGGLLMFDGECIEWFDMFLGIIGYILLGWVYCFVNIGDEFYFFFVVYLGGVGYDYGWVLEYGMGLWVFCVEFGVDLCFYVEQVLVMIIVYDFGMIGNKVFFYYDDGCLIVVVIVFYFVYFVVGGVVEQDLVDWWYVVVVVICDFFVCIVIVLVDVVGLVVSGQMMGVVLFDGDGEFV